MITDDDIHQAIDRIARTRDGELLYRHLQKILMGVLAVDQSESALRANLGERSLAAKLMGLMAEGIDESDARKPDSDGAGRATERLVVFRTSGAVNAGGRRESFREHALRTDPELAGRAGNTGFGN